MSGGTQDRAERSTLTAPRRPRFLMSEPIKRLAILGVGLIGGSFACALRKASAVKEIVGCGREQANLEQALNLGIVDHITHDAVEAVRGADVVLLAVPVNSIAGLYATVQSALSASAVVTDVGSTKGNVVQELCSRLGSLPANFVPGHPIAGTEKSGACAAFAELFEGRRVILTPQAETSPAATARVRQLWEICGARVSEMTASHHDEVLAATSHLPHLLAFALVDTLAEMEERREIFTYAAGGFRDFTRIASSHPVMWADICAANAPALLEVLDRFENTLMQLRSAITAGQQAELVARFARAKAARDRFSQLAGQPQTLTQAQE